MGPSPRPSLGRARANSVPQTTTQPLHHHRATNEHDLPARESSLSQASQTLISPTFLLHLPTSPSINPSKLQVGASCLVSINTSANMV